MREAGEAGCGCAEQRGAVRAGFCGTSTASLHRMSTARGSQRAGLTRAAWEEAASERRLGFRQHGCT